MEGLPTWRVSGDQQAIDFYRCYSLEYPYAEGVIHDDAAQVTLLFTGLEKRASCALTLTLEPVDLTAERAKFRADQDAQHRLGVENSVVESLQGLIQKAEGRAQIKVEARLDLATNAVEVTGIEKDAKKEHAMVLEDASEEWTLVEFDFYAPFSPVKIASLEFDKETTVKTLKCRHEVICQRFVMKPDPSAPSGRSPGANEYPQELRFGLQSTLDLGKDREMQVTLSGYCRRTPFSTRILATYREHSADGSKNLLKRYVFERKTQAVLSIVGGDDREFQETEFCVTYGGATLEGQGLIDLRHWSLQSPKSLVIGSAHRMVLGAYDNVFILNGSLQQSMRAHQSGEDSAFLRLTQVSKTKPGQFISKDEEEASDDDGDGKKEAGQDERHELQLPIGQVLKLIEKGGGFENENGLVYATKFDGERDISFVSAGYEYINSAPTVNFFTFDLRKVKTEEGDLVWQEPAVQSPIPQQFIVDYPLIAYKSFMSDNSEVVICNMALQKEPQHILHMRTWQFVCFVGTAMLRELSEHINKFHSKIFYVAKHNKLLRYRLLLLRLDPWKRGEKQADYGKVDCVQTVDFKLPPEPLSLLKKVDLLVGSGDDGSDLKFLVFQYETSLWSVSISVAAEPKRLLPAGDLLMNKRLTIRNMAMDASLFCLAYKADTEDNKVVKIAIAPSSNEVTVTPVFVPQSATIVALEMDPEDTDYLYALDDEQKLYRLLMTFDGKLDPEQVFDLSPHNIGDLIA